MDIDRPLNKRGLTAASFLGKYLELSGIQPDIIYVSPANRARQTIAQFSSQLQNRIKITDQIYPGSAESYLETLSKTPSKKCQSAMLVAHNPGLEDLVSILTAESMLVEMPTACMAIIEFPFTDWSRLQKPSRGILKGILPVKYLQAAQA